MPSHEKVLSLLKECQALREGHFVLASGKHSGHYVQVAQLCQYPDKLSEAIETCRDEIAAIEFKSFVSAAIGGLSIGQQLGTLHGKRHVFCERKDNVMMLRRGFQFEDGEPVLLVEDCMTTGGTVLEVKEIVEAAGAKVVGVFALVNRSGHRDSEWQGLKFVRTIDLDFPVFEADAVPEELAAIPVYRPGSKKIE